MRMAMSSRSCVLMGMSSKGRTTGEAGRRRRPPQGRGRAGGKTGHERPREAAGGSRGQRRQECPRLCLPRATLGVRPAGGVGGLKMEEKQAGGRSREAAGPGGDAVDLEKRVSWGPRGGASACRVTQRSARDKDTGRTRWGTEGLGRALMEAPRCVHSRLAPEGQGKQPPPLRSLQGRRALVSTRGRRRREGSRRGGLQGQWEVAGASQQKGSHWELLSHPPRGSCPRRLCNPSPPTDQSKLVSSHQSRGPGSSWAT